MSAAALMCRHCGASLVADVTPAPQAVVTYRRCPCRTPDHALRIRAEAAQRAENVARDALAYRRRTRVGT